jgi:hypothetical protein
MSPLKALIYAVLPDQRADELTERIDAEIVEPLMAEIAGLRAQVEEKTQELAVITSAVMKR